MKSDALTPQHWTSKALDIGQSAALAAVLAVLLASAVALVRAEIALTSASANLPDLPPAGSLIAADTTAPNGALLGERSVPEQP